MMYAVYTTIDARDVHLRNDWVTKAYGSTPEFALSGLQEIAETEKLIVTKLQGAVFPANAENLISILCKYLILDLSKETSSDSRLDHVNCVIEIVNRLLLKTTLNIKLLQFKRWKCIAVCCIIGLSEVCDIDEHYLGNNLIALFEKLNPGEFTHEELCDIKTVLREDCSVQRFICQSRCTRLST